MANNTKCSLQLFVNCNSISDLEPRFELGEVLISLSEVCPKLQILKKQQTLMYQKLVKSQMQNDDIFQYNWESKYLLSLYKNKISKNIDGSLFYKHTVELVDRILNITEKYYIIIEKSVR